MRIDASKRWRMMVVLVAVGALSVAACAARPVPDGSATGPPQQVEVRYAGGAVQGGVKRIPVGLGRSVALVVTSDVADEVHLHGYDRKVDVSAGGSSTLEFVADRSGVFEAELESRGEQLVQLEVR